LAFLFWEIETGKCYVRKAHAIGTPGLRS
jgi:hypothetical protein